MWHLLWQYAFAPCSFILIFSNLQCHTVAQENKQVDLLAHQDESSIKSMDIALSKRENVSQTQNSSVSVNKDFSLELLNNKTLPQIKRPITNGELNLTQSLPTWMATIKSGALQRTGFVALGFMSIIVVFFVVRGIRLRRKKSKSRKYGIITSTDMEMEPLDKDDDDEEETTLFDAQHKYSLP
ncbi:uncharacterized protein TNCT_628121 [Trichonephila clavata]|uniref:Uncharacterized protein n=1 Tax=Trichonephila clavata TaxID=2740835 RepID=A0A8X6LM35_TRICU|nr:uncharacterized protein TNCT_628121 [Trichonephila clavata]